MVVRELRGHGGPVVLRRHRPGRAHRARTGAPLQPRPGPLPAAVPLLSPAGHCARPRRRGSRRRARGAPIPGRGERARDRRPAGRQPRHRPGRPPRSRRPDPTSRATTTSALMIRPSPSPPAPNGPRVLITQRQRDSRNDRPMITKRDTIRAPRDISTTSQSDNTNDQENSKSNHKTKRKNNCPKNPTDNPHQCIARSDGVVRALRARAGDQHRIVFMIVYGGL